MPLSIPSWSQTKTGSKAGFDKVYNYVDKLGAPINRLSNKVGAEAFWPTTLDKESEKAARILRSFCKDGFYVQQDQEGKDEETTEFKEGVPRGKTRVLKKIPTEVIKNAKGLAIFTTMRTGLWVSGAGGSGILIARKADGEWSPPSGIMLHTAGLGFLIGVDIYDCVVVINTPEALQAFTKIRCTLGGEISASAGPVGIGGVMESEVHKRRAPVWNYLKSRGFYAGVQIDGTVMIQRQDENARFYGEKLSVDEILSGKAKHPPHEIQGLLATIKAAQGDQIDENLLPSADPTPGDFEVHIDESKRFGLPPSEDDPDPFGVKALEEEGMTIKEITPTGEKNRPSMDAFEYKPSPASPIFNAFTREGTFKRHSKRGSRDSGRLSISSVDRGTQTEIGLESPRPSDSPREAGHHSPIKKTTQNLAEEPEDADEGSPEEDSPGNHLHEAVIIEKAKIVTIPRRVPPPLPPRNPHRSSQLGSLASPIVADRPTSPLAFEHTETPTPTTTTTTTTGLGITTTASSSTTPAHSPRPSFTTEDDQSFMHPEHQQLSDESRDKDGFEPIHLTASQDAALNEELSHIPPAPSISSHHLQQQDRLSPSRQLTDRSIDDAPVGSGVASSNYSRAASPPPETTSPPIRAASPLKLDLLRDEEVGGAGDKETNAPSAAISSPAAPTAPAAITTTHSTTPAIMTAPVSTTTPPTTITNEDKEDIETETTLEKDEFHSIPGSPIVAEAKAVYMT